MALYLLYAKRGDRNAAGIHSVLVDAADEAAARTAAASAVPSGEVRIRNWAALSVADSPTLPDERTMLWFEGNAISLHGVTRGGSRLGIQ